jgi:hypothetical protein
MIQEYALCRFKTDIGLRSDEIFVKSFDGELSSLDTRFAAQLLNDPNRAVLDFYKRDGTHLGFVDGDYWEVRDPQSRRIQPNSAHFKPSSSIGLQLMRRAQSAVEGALMRHAESRIKEARKRL